MYKSDTIRGFPPIRVCMHVCDCISSHPLARCVGWAGESCSLISLGIKTTIFNVRGVHANPRVQKK